jgi:agmatine deiminase
MKQIIVFSILILSLSVTYAQVQLQSSIGAEEFGINTLMQKSISKNQKFNYYGHTNFELKYKNDSVGMTEFFQVVDYKLGKNVGLALGNTINKGDFLPEIGLSFSFEKKAFDLNFYPTVSYSLKSKAVGYGANGIMSFSPKINDKWGYYNLLIFGVDFDAESNFMGNQNLLVGLEYKQKLDFGLSLNLSNEQSDLNTSLGVFLGIKLFNFKTDELSKTSNWSNNNVSSNKSYEVLYTMPEESEPHEGTWLQWPHEYQYGVDFRDRLDPTWLAMTKALVTSEKVHLIAYDETEKARITRLLASEKVPMDNIDFKIYKTDDFWARDNGPIYVKDKSGNLIIEDWGFNAWGKKAKFSNCNAIPSKIAMEQGKTAIDINEIMVNEGGAIEIDGNGTLLATKSAILNSNRNPKMTEAQAEAIFAKYLGTTNFIWLDGVEGLEITDMHIDGFARFGNKNTIVTMSPEDLTDWSVPQNDIEHLYQAKNKNNELYTFVKLPLTTKDVSS